MNIFARKSLKKKASLQLSINAIVILVMAMVMLGLGLGFIRGLFTKGADNLGRVIDNNQLENKATYDDPLTIDRSVRLKAGNSAPVFIGVFNKDASGEVFSIDPGNTNCDTTAAGGGSMDIVLPTPFNVPQGEAVGLRGAISATRELTPGGYICKVTIKDSDDKYSSTSTFVEVVAG